MKNRFLKTALIISILIIAFISRFWQITKFPPSLFADEVDAGYQALVFSHQSTDYFGNLFPTHFHSFSDWRTPLYIYSISLVNKIISNPEISVRLPSAIFGFLAVIVLFKITKSYFAAFLLAISPWAIHYSRTGFEVSGMLLMILLGIYFWQRYLNSKKTILFCLSIIFYSLSIYFYSTAKLFIPIIILSSLIIWLKEIQQIKPLKLGLIATLGFIIWLPMIKDTFSGKSGYRFSYISILTEPHREQVTDKLRYEDVLLSHPGEIGVKTPTLSYILHNKYELVVERFIQNYVMSFSTDFLLLTGDQNIRHGFGGHGLFYLIDLPLLILGIYQTIKRKDKFNQFMFVLLITAPIPFALTRDSNSPHATRLILLLIPAIYFISKGFKSKVYLPIYLIFFALFCHYYFIHYPQSSAITWHSGMKETVLATKNYPNTNIYFSNYYESFVPFFAFYTQYLPITGNLGSNLANFQNDFFDGRSLENQYYFGHINFDAITPGQNIFVVPEDEYLAINQKDKFTLLQKIDKKYTSAQSFYLISKAPTSTQP